MLGIIMDSIRKNGLDAQYLCNFVNYSIYLKFQTMLIFS